jgi:hypothetical protein
MYLKRYMEYYNEELLHIEKYRDEEPHTCRQIFRISWWGESSYNICYRYVHDAAEVHTFVHTSMHARSLIHTCLLRWFHSKYTRYMLICVAYTARSDTPIASGGWGAHWEIRSPEEGGGGGALFPGVVGETGDMTFKVLPATLKPFSKRLRGINQETRSVLLIKKARGEKLVTQTVCW